MAPVESGGTVATRDRADVSPSHSCGGHGITDPCSPIEAASRLFLGLPSTHPPGLAAETVAVTAATILAVKALGVYCIPGLRWLAVPAVLVAAALIPAWIRKREFPCFASDSSHVSLALKTVGRVSIWVFPVVFVGLWLLKSWNVPIPLRPVMTGQQSPLTWLLYQFLYVAIAEEVFFRGYVQANATRLLQRAGSLSRSAQQYIGIVVSAACFALAHVVVQGSLTAGLVFLPGLIMAWLYLRTRSLLAPILFHGLANVSYGIMAAAVA